VRRLLPKLGERAGIEKRVHAHGLRHTMATEMVERGLPLHVIAGQLGHSSTATTDTYLAELMPSDRTKAIRAAGWAMDAEPVQWSRVLPSLLWAPGPDDAGFPWPKRRRGPLVVSI
jgi:hypothetical protein